MQGVTTFNTFYDGTSFQHLATVLISVFTLCYGPKLLFRGPFCISMRCSVFDRYRNFWGRNVSYPEEVASSTPETFVFMYQSYVTLHSNTHCHEILKYKFTINLYMTGPKEL